MTRIGEQTEARNYHIMKSNMADELQQQEIEENNRMETMQEEKDQEKKEHANSSSVRRALGTLFHAASTRRAKSTRHAWI